ncbi:MULTISPECIES: recombinase family protein [Sulfitobacter]|uniref:Recombinase family protein n=1 Tax=Sulfitobacter profundi TaxID=2679961 RepID=A0ABW1Z1M2_9RHOB|nr:recombinase family protein [Sulfitobacter indolifex]
MRCGYARVSTADQRHDLQVDALQQRGCEEIVQEVMSGAKSLAKRDALLSRLVEGDELVVWRLDRLGRSTLDVLEQLEDLQHRGIRFVTLEGNFDTGTPMGKTMLTIMASLAELERETLRERVKSGLEAARRRGAELGRRRSLNASQREQIVTWRAEGQSWRQIQQLFGGPNAISIRTLQRATGAQ